MYARTPCWREQKTKMSWCMNHYCGFLYESKWLWQAVQNCTHQIVANVLYSSYLKGIWKQVLWIGDGGMAVLWNFSPGCNVPSQYSDFSFSTGRCQWSAGTIRNMTVLRHMFLMHPIWFGVPPSYVRNMRQDL